MSTASASAALEQDAHSARLWSLPQPLAVLGSMLMVATAAAWGWADPGVVAGIVLLATLPVLLIAERLLPRRQDWALDRHDYLEDLFWIGTVFFIWAPIFNEFYDTPVSEAFVWVREASALPALLDTDGVLGLMSAAFAAAFISEFIYYWLHRLQHETLLFWRIHGTHHHVTRMGVARADRTHPLELLALNLGPAITLALLGANEHVVALFFVFRFVSGHVNHANLPLRSGLWGTVFTTAEWHQLHHSLERSESDSNYGCSIILFDRLFGTFNGNAHVARIGNGSGRPLSLKDQFMLPFRSNSALKAL